MIQFSKPTNSHPTWSPCRANMFNVNLCLSEADFVKPKNILLVPREPAVEILHCERSFWSTCRAEMLSAYNFQIFYSAVWKHSGIRVNCSLCSARYDLDVRSTPTHPSLPPSHSPCLASFHFEACGHCFQTGWFFLLHLFCGVIHSFI